MCTATCRVRVCIPHHYQGGGAVVGYGSNRLGSRVKRLAALARCLASIHALNRSPSDYILNVGVATIEDTPIRSYPPQALQRIITEVHIFVSGDNYLDEIRELAAAGTTIHRTQLSDPSTLPLAARDYLVSCNSTVDISIYMEDDLVISDPHFIDKLSWFFHATDHSAVLMPHRAEVCQGHRPCRLYVDGPLREDEIQQFYSPRRNALSLNFWNHEDIVFDIATNPHSGMFAISERQRTNLQTKELPRTGFVSPLETAATLTALVHFTIFKTSWSYRSFFTIEHAYPSYLGYLPKKSPAKRGFDA